jgi:dihydrodipicolinate synthase/N-acetylneuraminate lyase
MVPAARTSTRFPSWVLAVGLFAVSAGTYASVMSRVGPNLNSELEQEAARQDAAESRTRR